MYNEILGDYRHTCRVFMYSYSIDVRISMGRYLWLLELAVGDCHRMQVVG